MIMAVKKKLNNEEGQAIFEILVFLPIFLFFYTIIFNVGSAINVSINQQKVTRRYFYFLNKGNSFLPGTLDLETWGSMSYTGLSMLGYRDYAESDQPIAPCFEFSNFMTGDSGETCDTPLSGESKTNFIKIMTAYGICGESFFQSNGHWIVSNSTADDQIPRKNTSMSCIIEQ